MGSSIIPREGRGLQLAAPWSALPDPQLDANPTVFHLMYYFHYSKIIMLKANHSHAVFSVASKIGHFKDKLLQLHLNMELQLTNTLKCVTAGKLMCEDKSFFFFFLFSSEKSSHCASLAGLKLHV